MKFIYFVQDNDNLLKIAEKFRVDINDIIKLNKLEDGKIKRGDILQIPSGKGLQWRKSLNGYYISISYD